ncbi:MAG: FapA family protein [Candidatus Cloacimonas sp.]
MAKTFTSKDGNLILEIREKPLSAWLTINNTGKLIDENDIIALLEEANIKNGFEEAAEYMRLQTLEKEFATPFPIAMCNIKKSESMLRYNFNPDIIGNPETDVTFMMLSKLKLYHAGDVVAEYAKNIFEQGGSIYDIFGTLINSESVDLEQANNLVGINIAFDPQNLQFYALTDGYPYLDEQNHICLLNNIALRAEDIPSDNIFHCPIDLSIEGNLSFVTLRCKANLIINGDIHSCSIECAKNLFIKGDIISSSGRGIIIWGDLECRSIRNSYVVCLHNIHFTDTIENSTVVCDGDIIGDFETSEINGGLTQAGESIAIGKIGSKDNNEAEIEIAISPFYRNMLLILTKELIHWKEDKETNAIAINELENQIANYETALDEKLNQFLNPEQKKVRKISVSEVNRPPVTFRVLKHSYEINKPELNLIFVEKD